MAGTINENVIITVASQNSRRQSAFGITVTAKILFTTAEETYEMMVSAGTNVCASVSFMRGVWFCVRVAQ